MSCAHSACPRLLDFRSRIVVKNLNSPSIALAHLYPHVENIILQGPCGLNRHSLEIVELNLLQHQPLFIISRNGLPTKFYMVCGMGTFYIF